MLAFCGKCCLKQTLFWQHEFRFSLWYPFLIVEQRTTCRDDGKRKTAIIALAPSPNTALALRVLFEATGKFVELLNTRP